MRPRHVLLTTFGSLGDLHPYLAIGQALRERGHTVTLATQAIFQARVETAGLEFRALRVATIDEPSAEVVRRVFAGGAGVRYLLREVMMPCLRSAYEDTLFAARGADLLVSHPLTFATPLVAEKLGRPWLSTQLAPNGLHSLIDPPILPGWDSPAALWMARTFPRLYRGAFRAIWRLGNWQTGRWLAPVAGLRRELGLPLGRNPLLAGAHWHCSAVF